ncbi:MAG: hypothetical protein GPOALKHO_001583 [Sodalis sp.]|nr:MAG: hypothetical protein GPOALKHO_001583 [Sodalis sp.]
MEIARANHSYLTRLPGTIPSLLTRRRGHRCRYGFKLQAIKGLLESRLGYLAYYSQSLVIINNL